MGQPEPTSRGVAPLTYASAGVDIEAGDRAVELMRAAVARTHGGKVLGGVGGFAGLYDASELIKYRRPLLASSTDGVGTKVAVAQALDIHDTIGQDLVAMVVDDIVVTGARPLVMTDYIACGRVVPERIAAIVGGVARACEKTGTALVGGETAEHPGLMAPDEYDLAGAAVGVVEADDVLGPERVVPGDVVLGIASSGLHSNGFSLARAVVAHAGWQLDRAVPEFDRSLGEELLEPTTLYTAGCLDLVAGLGDAVHAFSHVTGGGLGANLARVLPVGLDAVVDRASWEVPAVFAVLGELGRVPWEDREMTWNLGIGMIAVVAGDRADDAAARLVRSGYATCPIGAVTRRSLPAGGERVVEGAKGVAGGRVRLTGAYRAAG